MIHFPKGEGFKFISQESEANVNDSVYFLPIDDKYFKLIIVSECGEKRELGFKLPISAMNNEIIIGTETDILITIAGVEFTKAQLQALKALVS